MRRPLFIAGAMVLGLAACGSGEGQPQASQEQSGAASAQAAASGDPCRLVTAEEVGAALGEKIVATKPGDGSCTYETEDAQGSSVTVEVAGADQMDIARTAAGALKDMGAEAAREGGAAGQEVNAMLSETGDAPKVGDEAFFGANSQISVRKGDRYIAVQPPIMRSRMGSGNPMLSGDERKKIALAIAEKAVSRLP